MLWLAWVLGIFGLNLQGETSPGPQILFLRLRLADGVITLTSRSVQPGRLKTPRSAPRGHLLSYEVKSATGLILRKSAMNHPGFVTVEAPDADEPGQLVRKQIKREPAEFVLRLPFDEAADTIEFYEQETSGAVRSERKFRGKISLASSPR